MENKQVTATLEESCGMCYRAGRGRVEATHKVGEEQIPGSTTPQRHNYTQYVCHHCFTMIMGTHATQREIYHLSSKDIKIAAYMSPETIPKTFWSHCSIECCNPPLNPSKICSRHGQIAWLIEQIERRTIKKCFDEMDAMVTLWQVERK